MTTSARSRRSAFTTSWLEPLIFVLLVEVYIWRVQLSGPAGNFGGFIVLLLLPVLSQILRRERPRDLGFRLDNLARSAREVGIMTAAAAAIVMAVGLPAGGGPPIVRPEIPGSFGYVLWALGQQYVLQSFVFRRFRARWRAEWAAAGAAALFAALHYPNAVLVAFTLAAGYVWCRLYEREPNLLTLALSHGLLALLCAHAIPAAWMHGLKVGPGYWLWRRP